MKSLRVVRRVSPAAERITLGGAAVHKAAPTAADANTHSAALPEKTVLERYEKEIAELLSRLERAERDKQMLEADLASIRSELVAAREAARQEGYREGSGKAQVESERALSEQLAAWRASAGEAAQGFEARLQAIRAELMEVVIAAVGKVLGEHLLNPQSLRSTLEQVLKEAGITGAVRMLIAPLQFEQLTRFGSAQLTSLRERKIEVAPDARVMHGGCLVETPAGLVDARFDVQLTKLREILADHYGPGSAAR